MPFLLSNDGVQDGFSPKLCLQCDGNGLDKAGCPGGWASPEWY